MHQPFFDDLRTLMYPSALLHTFGVNGKVVSAHNFRKKRAFFVKGATVATKCINKSRTILKRSSGSSLLVLA